MLNETIDNLKQILNSNEKVLKVERKILISTGKEFVNLNLKSLYRQL